MTFHQLCFELQIDPEKEVEFTQKFGPLLSDEQIIELTKHAKRIKQMNSMFIIHENQQIVDRLLALKMNSRTDQELPTPEVFYNICLISFQKQRWEILGLDLTCPFVHFG